jgi:hypothetical protein
MIRHNLDGPLTEVLSKLCPYSGWYGFGRGTTEAMRFLRERLIREGWTPWTFGGTIPPGLDVIHGPTGTYRRGGPQSRTKFYAGRWVRPRPEAQS